MDGRYELLKPEAVLELVEHGGSKARRVTRITLAAVFSLILVSFLHLQYGFDCRVSGHGEGGAEGVQQCPSNLAPLAIPPAPVNLWATLSVKEAIDIRNWLEVPARGLNLTRPSKAKVNDNAIFNVETYYPAKADAVAYLTSPESAPLPERYARVTIDHGGWSDPSTKDYLVGPLPISEKTGMRELTEIYHTGIPYNARGVMNFYGLLELLSEIMTSLEHVIQELFGIEALSDITAGASAPFSFDGSFRRFWVSWRRNTGGNYLQPLGLFTYLDISGSDTKEWKILQIVYNHQVFNSTQGFINAFHDGTLKRLPKPTNGGEVSWSTRKRIGAQRDLDYLPGPRQVSFAGLRYRVEQKQKYISWMGWGFYLAFDRDMGLSLWDIRMRNERIIYQLAPQEALAQYAGNDPVQSTTAWQDRYFGMGVQVRELIPGYDCPNEATFLSATTHAVGETVIRERGICVFEQDTGRPLTRHFGFDEGESGAAKGYILTVRSISTVGNYDYYGTIEVRVSASGYLQAGFWESTQSNYGTRIRDMTMGSLHDHVINFKVDLDVAGPSNSLLYTSTSQEKVEQPWFDDDWGTEVTQQKITREYIKNEDDALLKYPTNFQGGYSIVNQDQKNKWGTPRGYSIHPGFSPVHNTVVGSRRLLNNANWARYNLAVSRRKETEPSSSSMWNMNLPGAPPVDFHKFFDGENITQEDLVAWVNIGTHHLPSSEDTPNTRTNTATSSFFLTPQNYWDFDISIDSTNAILLRAPKSPNEAFDYDDYGVKPSHCVPRAPAPFEYYNSKVLAEDGSADSSMSIEQRRIKDEGMLRMQIEL